MQTDAERLAAERAALLEIRAAMTTLESGLTKYGRATRSKQALLVAKLLGVVRLQLEAEYQIG